MPFKNVEMEKVQNNPFWNSQNFNGLWKLYPSSWTFM